MLNHVLKGKVMYSLCLLLMIILNYYYLRPENNCAPCALWLGFLIGIFIVHAHIYRITGKLKI
jgi:hypothetical protein